MISLNFNLNSQFLCFSSKIKRGFVNNGFSLLVSSFFISLLFLFSFNYIDNSYGAFCKAVKYKDDGDNGYRIYIGTSTVGIDDCIIGSNHKDVIIGGDGDDHIKGKGETIIFRGDLTMIESLAMMMMTLSKEVLVGIIYMVMMTTM